MTALAYRLAEEPDMGLVVNSWVAAYRTSDDLDPLPMAVRNGVIREMVDHYQALESVEVWVAHHPGAAGTGADLYGWLALDRVGDAPPVLLFAYVKQPYRQMGIASGLLRAAGLSRDSDLRYRHKTGAITLARKKLPRLRPDRARGPRKAHVEPAATAADA